MEITITINTSLEMRGTEHAVAAALEDVARRIRLRGATPHIGDELSIKDANDITVGYYRASAGRKPSLDDSLLNARELSDKYGARNEHPDADRECWREQVTEGRTSLGYWEWVENQLDPDD